MQLRLFDSARDLLSCKENYCVLLTTGGVVKRAHGAMAWRNCGFDSRRLHSPVGIIAVPCREDVPAATAHQVRKVLL